MIESSVSMKGQIRLACAMQERPANREDSVLPYQRLLVSFLQGKTENAESIARYMLRALESADKSPTKSCGSSLAGNNFLKG